MMGKQQTILPGNRSSYQITCCFCRLNASLKFGETTIKVAVE
jgi:hypothetical protein